MSAELPSQLLTTEDVAWIWQKKKRTIQSWMADGEISYIRIGGRFLWKDVFEHIVVNRAISRRVEEAKRTLRDAGVSLSVVRLAEEDFERIERLIEVRVKAGVERALQQKITEETKKAA